MSLSRTRKTILFSTGWWRNTQKRLTGKNFLKILWLEIKIRRLLKKKLYEHTPSLRVWWSLFVVDKYWFTEKYQKYTFFLANKLWLQISQTNWCFFFLAWHHESPKSWRPTLASNGNCPLLKQAGFIQVWLNKC